jgi:hypothetical protein
MTNMYCNECINCVENPIIYIPQLKRENAEIDIHVQIDDNFICTHCKTNIIVCDVPKTKTEKKIDNIQQELSDFFVV